MIHWFNYDLKKRLDQKSRDGMYIAYRYLGYYRRGHIMEHRFKGKLGSCETQKLENPFVPKKMVNQYHESPTVVKRLSVANIGSKNYHKPKDNKC